MLPTFTSKFLPDAICPITITFLSVVFVDHTLHYISLPHFLLHGEVLLADQMCDDMMSDVLDDQDPTAPSGSDSVELSSRRAHHDHKWNSLKDEIYGIFDSEFYSPKHKKNH